MTGQAHPHTHELFKRVCSSHKDARTCWCLVLHQLGEADLCAVRDTLWYYWCYKEGKPELHVGVFLNGVTDHQIKSAQIQRRPVLLALTVLVDRCRSPRRRGVDRPFEGRGQPCANAGLLQNTSQM